ncbi:MAG: hypothetical protein ABSC23_10340 [Bryobacteraceae bacterium]|jgi:hypothetical protein
MLASALIIGLSLILLAYWFRYSCLLLLRDGAQVAASPQAASDPRFSFVDVQRRIDSAQDLDPLQRALQRDYKVLVFLFEHASGLGLGSLEDRLLVLDYKMMQWWYRVTKPVLPSQARHALAEMASILDVLVRRMGEQSSVYTRA